jgi:hypothetical protein
MIKLIPLSAARQATPSLTKQGCPVDRANDYIIIEY